MMSHIDDNDFALALQLQQDLFQDEDKDPGQSDTTKPHNNPSQPMSLVDPQWELTDPNPDVRALFLAFNEQFFWGRLAGIEVRWSPRMTLCAGLCCYEGRGGLCSVRLSVPLLKLRPRKDLVETLLHEMIHAYLFVTDNNKDHDGHGPEFHKHMYRINKEAGTSISVYHNFHDEVNVYKQHWWRCDGPCQKRKPYFGFVKRSMNRAPSKNDTWWVEHQRTCGGSYTKVKEPEDYGKKKGKKAADGEKEAKKGKDSSSGGVRSMDIRVFGGQGRTASSITSTATSVSASKPSDKTSSMFGTSGKIPAMSGSRMNSLGDFGTVTGPLGSAGQNSRSPKTGDRIPGTAHNIPGPSKFNKISHAKVIENKSKGGHPMKDSPRGTTTDTSTGSNKQPSAGGSEKFVSVCQKRNDTDGTKPKKKQKFHVKDFSDSDDDIPLFDLHRSDKASSISGSSDGKCDMISEETVPVSVKAGPEDARIARKTPGDADDVRAMLRKVWGEKRFANPLSTLNTKPPSSEEIPDNRINSRKRLQSLVQEEQVHKKSRIIKDLNTDQEYSSATSIARTSDSVGSQDSFQYQDGATLGRVKSTHLISSKSQGLVKDKTSKDLNRKPGLSSNNSVSYQTSQAVGSLSGKPGTVDKVKTKRKSSTVIYNSDSSPPAVSTSVSKPVTSPIEKLFNTIRENRKQEKPGVSARGDNPGATVEQTTSMVPCPVCNSDIATTKINEHLDSCLSLS